MTHYIVVSSVEHQSSLVEILDRWDSWEAISSLRSVASKVNLHSKDSIDIGHMRACGGIL